MKTMSLALRNLTRQKKRSFMLAGAVAFGFFVVTLIEGLVSGVGSHAGGMIIVDKPFTESTALMRTKSGDIITQYDLHMCEAAG